jgi:dihydrofolate reductase
VRKIVLCMSVSVDGYMQGPDGGLNWQPVDDELHQHFNDELRAMGGFLDGRVTYELMTGYWPTADADPANSATEAEFADIWRDMPKIVFSRTLEHAGCSATIVREVVPEEIGELKAQPGGDLALGGADLAATFLRHDLADEDRLYVHPVRLGHGKRVFPATDADSPLRLAETRSFGSGVVLRGYGRLDRR